MNQLVNLFNYIRWLSLDIALGGAILLLFITRLYELTVPFSVVGALVLSILLVYTADHLLDAKRIKAPSMPRHQFHKRHTRIILIYLGALCLLGIVVLFYLPQAVLYAGLLLAGFCLIYLSINQALSKSGVKEFLVALAYSTAMFLMPMLSKSLEALDYVMFFQLFILALANLAIISYYEDVLDHKDLTTTIIRVLPARIVRLLIYGGLISNLILSLIFFYEDYMIMYQLFILPGTCVLLVVISLKKIFQQHERYRWLSDFVFFIPILL